MNKSAIMQMFYGHRGNGDMIEMSAKHKEILKEFSNANKLRKKLQEFPELVKLYERVGDINEVLLTETADTYFYEGFSFGLVMGVEAGMR